MTINLEARKASLAILLTSDEMKVVQKAFADAGGDVDKAIVILKLVLGVEQFAKFDRANKVSDWADDDVSILNLVKTNEIPTLRELALSLDDVKLSELIPNDLPADEAKRKLDGLRVRLFVAETHSHF